jgi:hypothetical protein
MSKAPHSVNPVVAVALIVAVAISGGLLIAIGIIWFFS